MPCSYLHPRAGVPARYSNSMPDKPVPPCRKEPHLNWCQIGDPPPAFGMDDEALEKLLVEPLFEPFLRKAAEAEQD